VFSTQNSQNSQSSEPSNSSQYASNHQSDSSNAAPDQQQQQRQSEQQQNSHENQIEILRKQISELEFKIKDLHDRYLRALSDAENARHRAKIDVENATKFSISNFSKSLIDVADTLELAANAVKIDVERSENQLIKSIYEGLIMIEKTLQKAFESHGVKKVSDSNCAVDSFLRIKATRLFMCHSHIQIIVPFSLFVSGSLIQLVRNSIRTNTVVFSKLLILQKNQIELHKL